MKANEFALKRRCLLCRRCCNPGLLASPLATVNPKTRSTPVMATERFLGSPTHTGPPHPHTDAVPRADPSRTTPPRPLHQTTTSATRAPPTLRYRHASSSLDTSVFVRSSLQYGDNPDLCNKAQISRL